MIAHEAGNIAMAPAAVRADDVAPFVGDVTGLVSSLELSPTIFRHPFDLP